MSIVKNCKMIDKRSHFKTIIPISLKNNNFPFKFPKANKQVIVQSKSFIKYIIITTYY